jgi:hypothetical protein
VILFTRFSARSVVLNKAAIKSTLNDIPENSKVIISAEDTVYIAHDILDLIESLKIQELLMKILL